MSYAPLVQVSYQRQHRWLGCSKQTMILASDEPGALQLSEYKAWPGHEPAPSKLACARIVPTVHADLWLM